MDKNITDAGSISSDLSKGGGAVKSVLATLNRRSEINPDDSEGLTIKRINRSVDKKRSRKNLALVGQSGSGKSTVIGMIERFYDPMRGSIRIEERDLKDYNLRDLRLHIALVSQEPTLFAGSIRYNIVCGKKEACESDIRNAAKLANAHEFISSMKDGYGTYSGERAVQVGQRIALAQAILQNPSILLLDEATSALDSV
ncbi:hypothetical protein L2E82_09219 [Cichorium intybus]|uniref:Uncharacterized protein n=1 Tax=Cichorium intybus TaxID=13427 RepID=A0ACB9G7S0_CICIN|nr:hypothetical protein L2E82_09219 [Cichorium intybus]